MEALALPCYLASLTAVQPIIDNRSAREEAATELAMTKERFRAEHPDAELPVGTAANRQRAWDTIAATTESRRLLATANQLHRARLVAANQPHTGAWLQAVPVPSLGLLLDEDTVRVAVALRLGAQVCVPHRCRCGQTVDRLGHHGLSCRFSAGRFPRHASLNDVVKRGLASAGVPAVLEPVGLDRGDGRRPDGLTVFPYSEGRSLIWDATCVDTYAATALVESALEPGSAATAAEERKRRRYEALSDQYRFVPLAVETTGVLGPACASFLAELGRRITACTGEKRETAWLRQRISVAVARGNAVSITSATRSNL